MVLDQRRLLIAVVTSYVCRNCPSRSDCTSRRTISPRQMGHNSARFWTLRPCSLWPRKLRDPWSQSNRIVQYTRYIMLSYLPSHTARCMLVALGIFQVGQNCDRLAGNPAWQMSPGSERGLSILQNSRTVCDLTATNP